MRKRCKDCQTPTLDSAPYCDACGSPFPKEPEPKGWTAAEYAILWITVGTAVVIFRYFVLG